MRIRRMCVVKSIEQSSYRPSVKLWSNVNLLCSTGPQVLFGGNKFSPFEHTTTGHEKNAEIQMGTVCT
jgi:hypothetical protein